MALTITELKNLVNSNLADNSNIVPAEHRAVELALIDYLETLQPISNSNIPVNRGYITANNAVTGGLEVGINLGTTLSNRLRYNGNVTAVSCTSTDGYTTLTINLQNAHPNNNYIVKSWYEQTPTTSISIANSSVGQPVYKIINGSQFQIVMREFHNQTQALRLHFETTGY